MRLSKRLSRVLWANVKIFKLSSLMKKTGYRIVSYVVTPFSKTDIYTESRLAVFWASGGGGINYKRPQGIFLG